MTECGESEYLRQYVWINPNDYMTCTKHNFVYEEASKKQAKFSIVQEVYDGLIWKKLKEESEI